MTKERVEEIRDKLSGLQTIGDNATGLSFVWAEYVRDLLAYIDEQSDLIKHLIKVGAEDRP